jgi:hypothetical protein
MAGVSADIEPLIKLTLWRAEGLTTQLELFLKPAHTQTHVHLTSQ